MTRRLSEVAQKVGVSEATVSRVLNGKPGVSEATRQAVLTALDVLGYERPTQLRGERARLVGLVLPELQNPIFPALADVVGSALAQQGFTPVLCTCTGGVSEPGLRRAAARPAGVRGRLRRRQPRRGRRRARPPLRAGPPQAPVVLVNASIELDYPIVSCDDAVAVEQAFGHLVALGHQQIGLVLGPRDHIPSQRKYVAFQACAERIGLPVGEDNVGHTMFSVEGGQAVGTRLVQNGVTGLILRERPARARRDPRGPPHGPAHPTGRLGHRLRRLRADDLHRSAADHGAPAHRGHGPRRGRAARHQIAGIEVSLEELLFEPELVVRSTTGRAPLY